MNKLNSCLIGIGSGGCNITKILFDTQIQFVSLGGRFGSNAVVDVAKQPIKSNKKIENAILNTIEQR